MLIHSFIVVLHCRYCIYLFFFFNDTATTEIYTLSLHDALPILDQEYDVRLLLSDPALGEVVAGKHRRPIGIPCLPVVERSEEHTSELQSRSDLVCRLLLEKKKKITRRSMRLYSTRRPVSLLELI